MGLIGIIVGNIFGFAVTVLVFTLLLKLTCWIVARFSPSFGMALKASFLGMVASAVVFVVVLLGTVFIGSGYFRDDYMLKAAFLFVALMCIMFFVQTAVYAKILKKPEGNSIGFPKALLINIVIYVFLIVISGVFSLIGLSLS